MGYGNIEEDNKSVKSVDSNNSVRSIISSGSIRSTGSAVSRESIKMVVSVQNSVITEQNINTGGTKSLTSTESNKENGSVKRSGSMR